MMDQRSQLAIKLVDDDLVQAWVAGQQISSRWCGPVRVGVGGGLIGCRWDMADAIALRIKGSIGGDREGADAVIVGILPTAHFIIGIENIACRVKGEKGGMIGSNR